MIDMVYLSRISVFESHDQAMHLDYATGIIGCPLSIEAPGLGRVPLPLHKPVKVSGIDQGKLALRERYCAVG